MRGCAAHIGERIRARENRERMVAPKEAVPRGHPAVRALIRPAREFVRAGRLALVHHAKGLLPMRFLPSDTMLWAEEGRAGGVWSAGPSGGGAGGAPGSSALPGGARPRSGTDAFGVDCVATTLTVRGHSGTLLRVEPLEVSGSERPDTEASSGTRFQVLGSASSVVVAAASEADARVWVADLRRCVEQSRARARSRRQSVARPRVVSLLERRRA